MPTKTKPQPTVTIPDMPAPLPWYMTTATRDDVKHAALWVAQHTNRVPCLWGPTASGKTYMAHEIATEVDGELITVLLSQFTPDEEIGRAHV